MESVNRVANMESSACNPEESWDRGSLGALVLDKGPNVRKRLFVSTRSIHAPETENCSRLKDRIVVVQENEGTAVTGSDCARAPANLLTEARMGEKGLSYSNDEVWQPPRSHAD